MLHLPPEVGKVKAETEPGEKVRRKFKKSKPIAFYLSLNRLERRISWIYLYTVGKK
jgi:hypothetical protein